MIHGAAPRLSRAASGLRHLRWAREVLATLQAHAEHNGRLDPAERALVRDEARALGEAIHALRAAVKPYRDFLEQTRVHYRGRVRMAAALNAAAADDAAAALLARFEAELADMEATQRRPLREAVTSAKDRLRQAMQQMDARLAARLSAAFVEDLYPPLAGGDAFVADDDDPDDDATATTA